MLLSIIVPIYNVEEFLPRCLDSILVQTFTDFELILIDDGSPDRCGKIIDEYAKVDSRIVVVHQENRGVSAARNEGLRIAQGRYIGFVDPDDWIEPNMYETLLEPFKKDKRLSICAGGIVFHDSINGIERMVDASSLENTLQSSGRLMKLIAVSHSNDRDIILQSLLNKVFRKTLFEDISFNGGFGEDCAVITEFFAHNCLVKFENCPLYHYNIHELSLTQNKHIEDRARFLDIYKRRVELYQDEDIVVASKLSYCQTYAYYYCEFRENKIPWPYDTDTLRRYYKSLKRMKKCSSKMEMQMELLLFFPEVYYMCFYLRKLLKQ